jgi:histidinol dehydrogenase
VIADASANPGWVAADLLAQAEHDPDARAIFVTPRRRLAAQVAAEVTRQMPPDGPARRAIATNGAIVVTRSLDEAFAVSERMAPEHAVCDSLAQAERIRRAGTVFVGPLSAQACGDYVTGSNHVLPTSGAARARGGLTAADFVRVSTVQQIAADGLRRVGPAGVALANAEGLHAHAASILMRLDESRNDDDR